MQIENNFFDRNNGTYVVLIFKAFFEKPKTMMQVSKETGIERAYITWIIRPWRDNNTISITKYDKCPETGANGVQFLTTDPDLFPNPDAFQLNLF